MTTGTIEQLPADRIHPGNNDRKHFNREALEQLAASIAANGLAQPIVVRPADDGWEIVAGERRYRAITTILGWDRVPAVVRDYDDRTASAVMLAENTARTELNPIEECDAYLARLDAGYTLDEISTWAGKDKGTITWICKLAALVPEARHLVAVGQLSVTQGWHVARLDVNRQRIALHALATSPLTVNELAAIVDRLEAEAAAEPLFDADLFLQVEEWVAEEAEKRAGRVTRSDLIAMLSEAAAHVPPQLADKIAAAVAAG